MRTAAGLAALALAAGVIAAACTSASSGIAPIGATDAQTACPGGRLLWNLEITDQRAERKDSDKVRALIRDSLSRSFPGCQWANPPRPDAPTIAIELHTFGTTFDGGMWDGAAEWGVTARTASGQGVTQFEAEAQASRPDYRGYNNEREVLRAAFEKAFERMAAGLRNLPNVQ